MRLLACSAAILVNTVFICRLTSRFLRLVGRVDLHGRKNHTAIDKLAVLLFSVVRSRWMNEWMNVYLYTAHITYCLKAVNNSIEWDRTSACKGASGCRYRFIFDLTRPPNPCMKCTMQLQIDHDTGNYVPYSFRKVCGSFNVPCWPRNIEDAGDGAYGL